jgi:aminoglycoside phosphotransferase
LAYRPTAFEARYKTAACPFDWRTRKGLNRLLTRIAE